MITGEVFMDIKAMYRNGLSIRKIARITGLHRLTVKRHVESESFPEYHRTQRRKSVVDPYLKIIEDYLEQDDYQATWIYDRLARMGYTGSYSRVKEVVRSLKGEKRKIAYRRFETEPALQAQVDWGDFQIEEPDGTVGTVYAFIMVLGFSRALYVEFVEKRTLESFMDCHIHAFDHFGGPPREVLYDRMKHVVVGKENGRPVLNREFLHFSYHYGFLPRLCPPYAPWVKGKSERPIHFLRERFWRGYTYRGLDEANRDVRIWLETANRRVHGTHGRPVDARWAQERPLLSAMPPVPYDTALKVFRPVYKECQLSYNGNRYLVPHEFALKKVMLKIKGRLIRIYHDHDLIATYEEPDGKHRLVGDPAIYARLAADREQNQRKYGRRKGRATRGLTTRSLFPEVTVRSLAEYEQFAGGAPWSN